MKIQSRILNIDLPPRQSTFLWGPRKTGKTTYLKANFPDSFVYDFLKTDLFLEFSKKPSLLREQVLAKDEKTLNSQKVIDYAGSSARAAGIAYYHAIPV